jgi:hypothetical protein
MSLKESPGFSKPHFDIWKEIGQQVFREIPTFSDIWNPAVEANMKIAPFDPDQGKNLAGYVESLVVICEQGLYAIECLKEFSSHEASNITEFYVSYFLNDFIARVKTGTDLLALIIQQIYELGIDDKMCSLESGPFVGHLRSSKFRDKTVESLAKEIDRVRTQWLECFDKLRDIAIHRTGFRFTMTIDTGYPVQIQLTLPKALPKNQPIPIQPNDPIAVLKPFMNDEPLLRFLTKIGSKSVSKYLISVNPVTLCKEVWKLWSKSSENILGIIKKDLLAQL